jgi:hypothetical protein
MSVHVSSNVWRSCPQKHDRLLLMIALADYCNDEGYCWPSQASIAKRIRGTERGVVRMLDELIAEGEIEVHRKGGSGRGDTTVYLLARYSEGGLCTTFGLAAHRSKKDDPEAKKGTPAPGTGAVERKNHHSNGSAGEHVVNIYDAYPRKIGRPAALKAIAKALKTMDPARLLELTQKYAAAVAGTDQQYIPYPQKWFNQERYNDDPKTWGRAADKKSGGRSSINARNSNADAASQY